MAQELSTALLEEVSHLNYQDYMPEVKTGDLLFFSGDYLVSHSIAIATNSIWSHVGILINLEELERTFLLESVYGDGVRLLPLSKYVRDYQHHEPYKGELVLTHVEGVGPKESQAIIQYGINLISAPYDTDEIVKNLFRILANHGQKKRDREYTCSELVYECYLAGGIEFPYDKRGFISPNDIWKDPRVSIIGKLISPKKIQRATIHL